MSITHLHLSIFSQKAKIQNYHISKSQIPEQQIWKMSVYRVFMDIQKNSRS